MGWAAASFANFVKGGIMRWCKTNGCDHTEK